MNQTELPDGRWVEAKPLLEPFSMRLKRAWHVLVGDADAKYYDGQDRGGVIDHSEQKRLVDKAINLDLSE